MIAKTGTVTADDLLHQKDDGYRYELIQGVLRKMSPAGSEHGRIAMRIGRRLGQYVETHGLGETFAAETGFRIASNPDTVRAPDAAFGSPAGKKRPEALAKERGVLVGTVMLSVLDSQIADWRSAFLYSHRWREAESSKLNLVGFPANFMK